MSSARSTSMSRRLASRATMRPSLRHSTWSLIAGLLPLRPSSSGPAPRSTPRRRCFRCAACHHLKLSYLSIFLWLFAKDRLLFYLVFRNRQIEENCKGKRWMLTLSVGILHVRSSLGHLPKPEAGNRQIRCASVFGFE